MLFLKKIFFINILVVLFLLIYTIPIFCSDRCDNEYKESKDSCHRDSTIAWLRAVNFSSCMLRCGNRYGFDPCGCYSEREASIEECLNQAKYSFKNCKCKYFGECDNLEEWWNWLKHYIKKLIW